MVFNEGESFRTMLPNAPFNRTFKVHIRHVVSSIYKGRKLIILAYFGIYKKWWHEELIEDRYLEFYIELTKKHHPGLKNAKK